MIKSGATIQNRYLNNPYPTNYNSLGRPGNFDVARPHDSSSVFDTGMPKDVSPYQPRVAVSVEIQPNSVFKPRRLQRQAKQTNGAKWGQTALKSIFGGEESVITNYMAQRLLGIVEDDRMTQSMQSVANGNLMDFRGQAAASSATSQAPVGSAQSDTSMQDRETQPTPAEVADLTDLSLGESPLQISIPDPNLSSVDVVAENALADAVAEVETQPTEAARQGGLLVITQETAAGLATITPRRRGFGPNNLPDSPTDSIGAIDMV